jgi:pimeloyl-ACP methyl ester carboxylesterase
MNRFARFHLVRVRGVDVHWAEAGEGTPLVLLHGLADSHRTWSRAAPLLAEKRRVLMPDLPGHGLSSRPDASYSIAWQAEIIAAWLDALDLHQVDIVGHSYGGGVAQYLLLVDRARIRRLALVGSGGLGRDVMPAVRLLAASKMVETMGGPLIGPVTRLVINRWGGTFDADEVRWLAWANAMPGTARSLSRTVRDVVHWRMGQVRHISNRIHEIGELPPMRVFWGTHDKVIPSKHLDQVTELLEGVSHQRFDCGHYPHRECPEEFSRELLEFVDGAEPTAPRLKPVTEPPPPLPL